MSQTVLGTTGIVEQPVTFGWSPTRGAYTRRTWEAAGAQGKLNARGFCNQLRLQNVEYEVQDSYGKTRITATYGNEADGREEIPVSVWEVRSNRISKDFFQTPVIYRLKDQSFTGLAAINGDTLLDLLKQTVQAQAITSEELDRVETATDAAQQVFFEAYNLALSGAHEFIVEQSVVVNTKTVSASFNRTIVTINQGKVLTEAQMIELELAPATTVETIPLPTGLSQPQDSATGYGFIYGYRKNRPEMHQTAFNKWQVVTQWEQGFWSTLLYSGV